MNELKSTVIKVLRNWNVENRKLTSSKAVAALAGILNIKVAAAQELFLGGGEGDRSTASAAAAAACEDVVVSARVNNVCLVNYVFPQRQSKLEGNVGINTCIFDLFLGQLFGVPFAQRNVDWLWHVHPYQILRQPLQASVLVGIEFVFGRGGFCQIHGATNAQIIILEQFFGIVLNADAHKSKAGIRHEVGQGIRYTVCIEKLKDEAATAHTDLHNGDRVAVVGWVIRAPLNVEPHHEIREPPLMDFVDS